MRRLRSPAARLASTRAFDPLRARQQNAAFLEGLADRGDPETQIGGIEPLAPE